MKKNYSRLEKCIHYEFSQVKLLETALTHSSYANERPGECQDNERLEFLGDAVLELVISEELFRRFPDVPEGHLTRLRSKLVKEKTLAEVACAIELNEYLLLGRGEESQGGRDRPGLLADSLEALLGAVFLDGGFDQARTMVLRLFGDKWPESAKLPKAKDFKSKLQEYTQRNWRDRPVYSLEGTAGPEHEKVFTVAVHLPEGEVFKADGPSVKKAEQTAACMAMDYYHSRDGR